ncbi:MAG: hypothetical protein AAGG02_19740, partial [Cyanobacteria bacterium P01_H01_bin.15]
MTQVSLAVLDPEPSWNPQPRSVEPSMTQTGPQSKIDFKKHLEKASSARPGSKERMQLLKEIYTTLLSEQPSVEKYLAPYFKNISDLYLEELDEDAFYAVNGFSRLIEFGKLLYWGRSAAIVLASPAYKDASQGFQYYAKLAAPLAVERLIISRHKFNQAQLSLKELRKIVRTVSDCFKLFDKVFPSEFNQEQLKLYDRCYRTLMGLQVALVCQYPLTDQAQATLANRRLESTQISELLCLDTFQRRIYSSAYKTQKPYVLKGPNTKLQIKDAAKTVLQAIPVGWLEANDKLSQAPSGADSFNFSDAYYQVFAGHAEDCLFRAIELCCYGKSERITRTSQTKESLDHCPEYYEVDLALLRQALRSACEDLLHRQDSRALVALAQTVKKSGWMLGTKEKRTDAWEKMQHQLSEQDAVLVQALSAFLQNDLKANEQRALVWLAGVTFAPNLVKPQLQPFHFWVADYLGTLAINSMKREQTKRLAPLKEHFKGLSAPLPDDQIEKYLKTIGFQYQLPEEDQLNVDISLANTDYDELNYLLTLSQEIGKETADSGELERLSEIRPKSKYLKQTGSSLEVNARTVLLKIIELWTHDPSFIKESKSAFNERLVHEFGLASPADLKQTTQAMEYF